MPKAGRWSQRAGLAVQASAPPRPALLPEQKRHSRIFFVTTFVLTLVSLAGIYHDCAPHEFVPIEFYTQKGDPVPGPTSDDAPLPEPTPSLSEAELRAQARNREEAARQGWIDLDHQYQGPIASNEHMHEVFEREENRTPDELAQAQLEMDAFNATHSKPHLINNVFCRIWLNAWKSAHPDWVPRATPAHTNGSAGESLNHNRD